MHNRLVIVPVKLKLTKKKDGGKMEKISEKKGAHGHGHAHWFDL